MVWPEREENKREGKKGCISWVLEATANLKRYKSRSICVSGAEKWKRAGRPPAGVFEHMYLQVCMFWRGSSLTFPQGAGLSCREDRIFYLGWCPNQSEWQWWRHQCPDPHTDPTLPSVIINPYWGRVLRLNHNYLFSQHERKTKLFHDYRICAAVQRRKTQKKNLYQNHLNNSSKLWLTTAYCVTKEL